MQNVLKSKGMINVPGLMLRLEGLVLLIVSVFLYAWSDYPWLWFAILFLFPDLALFVYLANKQTGVTVYNLFHTITLPILLAILGLVTGDTLFVQVSLIWLAHIGLDRTVGYGLKYVGELKDTHLQRV